MMFESYYVEALLIGLFSSLLVVKTNSVCQIGLILFDVSVARYLFI